MEKKDLIKLIDKFLLEKGFKLQKKSGRGILYIYETKDLFLRFFLDHSSYSDLKYLRYTFGIKALCGDVYDETNPFIGSFYSQLNMGALAPKDFDSVRLYAELNKLYLKYLEPIIEKGLEYICSSKSLISKEPKNFFIKEVLEYINQYKVANKIK